MGFHIATIDNDELVITIIIDNDEHRMGISLDRTPGDSGWYFVSKNDKIDISMSYGEITEEQIDILKNWLNKGD